MYFPEDTFKYEPLLYLYLYHLTQHLLSGLKWQVEW